MLLKIIFVWLLEFGINLVLIMNTPEIVIKLDPGLSCSLTGPIWGTHQHILQKYLDKKCFYTVGTKYKKYNREQVKKVQNCVGLKSVEASD